MDGGVFGFYEASTPFSVEPSWDEDLLRSDFSSELFEPLKVF